MEQYKALLSRLAEIGHFGNTIGMLHWDQQCYMPPKGIAGRAQQLAVLGKISHEMTVSDDTRKLLEEAESETASLDPESDERLTLRVVRRDFDKATKIPTPLVVEMA